MTRQDQNSCYRGALKLAAAGVPVFPCKEDKSPCIGRSFHKATTDTAQISEWWSRWPNALIGVPAGKASGLWIADADIDKTTGKATGELSLAAFGLGYHIHQAATPSGGVHYFFRWKEGLPRSSVRKLPCVDVRSDGGYIIAWDPDAVCAAKLDAHLPCPPSDLIEALKAKKPTQPTAPAHSRVHYATDLDGSQQSWAETAFQQELVKVRSAEEGTRNDTLNRSAFALGQIVGGGRLVLERVRRELIAAACSVGLPEAEALRTVDGALKAGIAEPRGPKHRDAAMRIDAQENSGDPGHSTANDSASSAGQTPGATAQLEPDMSLLRPPRSEPPPFPCDFLSPEWQSWVEAAGKSKGAPPDYVLAGLLSVAGALIGNARWVSPWADWEEPPVVWSMIVGNPSAGKTPAMQAVIGPLKALEKEIQRAFRAEALLMNEEQNSE